MNASNTKRPTPYPGLNGVLDKLIRGIQAILEDSFISAYLQGSFAVGDFDSDSDVDFIIAIEQDLAVGQVDELQAFHKRIYSLNSNWAQHLEGSYFPKTVLNRYSLAGYKLWYLDHGASSLVRSDHCNTIVVRWVVREKGVILAGPNPRTLIPPIAVDLLRQDILATIHEWGRQILADPQQINNRFYQGYAVLNYSRMLHDLQTGNVGSKRSGAEWAKENLDPNWSGLIDRAWKGRPDPAYMVRQPADPDELSKTLAFVWYVMEASLEIAAINGITEA